MQRLHAKKQSMTEIPCSIRNQKCTTDLFIILFVYFINPFPANRDYSCFQDVWLANYHDSITVKGNEMCI